MESKILEKKKTLKNFWEKDDYYVFAKDVTLAGFLKNSGLKRLRKYVSRASNIIDIGCGDGVNIEMIWHHRGNFWGVDISEKAISLAKERLKGKNNTHFMVGNIEKLNFPSETFDLVYIAYTLEHLDYPEIVIKEMIRLTKKNGYLIFVSPNYGSPISYSPSSPPRGETLTTRAIKQFFRSHIYLIKKPKNLEWIRVEPLCLKENDWKPDWDTVVEPYIQTLLYFLERQGLKIVEHQTQLSSEKEKLISPANLKHKLLRLPRNMTAFLGDLGVPPYRYFGPDFLVVAQKLYCAPPSAGLV